MNNNRIKKIVAVFSLLIMASAFTGCNEESEGERTRTLVGSYYKIVVDEETLVQYIQWNSRPDYPSDARIGGMTVRVKEDGTPYTIAREDLDKYTHFRFNNPESKEQE